MRGTASGHLHVTVTAVDLLVAVPGAGSVADTTAVGGLHELSMAIDVNPAAVSAADASDRDIPDQAGGNGGALAVAGRDRDWSTRLRGLSLRVLRDDDVRGLVAVDGGTDGHAEAPALESRLRLFDGHADDVGTSVITRRVSLSSGRGSPSPPYVALAAACATLASGSASR